jgi:hypothetical protein
MDVNHEVQPEHRAIRDVKNIEDRQRDSRVYAVSIFVVGSKMESKHGN